MTDELISKYADYVNANSKLIAEYVDDCFEESKNDIKLMMLSKIKTYLTPIPIHYELDYDDYEWNPYDHSGVLKPNGYIDLNQTISNFLKEEYSGQREPTFVSCCGWRYNTYDDELNWHLRDMVMGIMYSAIRHCLEFVFDIQISDDEFWDIKDCDYFEDVEEECLAADVFFSCESMIEFTGIGDMLLSDVINLEIGNDPN